MKKILYIFKDKIQWEIRLLKLCNSLKSNGFEVQILAKWDGETEPTEEFRGFTVNKCGFNKKASHLFPLSINSIWQESIKEQITVYKPDLIIVREFFLGVAAAKAAHRYNIPVIMDMAEHYPGAMRGFKKYQSKCVSRFAINTLKLPDILEKHAVKMMDGIIVVCDEQINRLSNDLGFNKDNIKVIHNSPYKAVNFKGEFHFNNPPKILGIHGHLTGEKSLTNLINGFLIIAEQFPDLKLLIAGNGECYNDYKSIIKKSGLENRFEMIGKYTYNQLPGIMRKIDIGVIPYQISEFNNFTIHNKIFDFFAFGKPLLVSNALPLKRIINETHAGIASSFESPQEAAESIKLMLKADLKQFAENSQKAFETYNWENEEPKLIDFIKRFL